MVFDPQISTKVDELKDKVEETKSDMDSLTLMSDVLEKQRKQEEIEGLLTRIESDLDGLETTLTQQESTETDPQAIDLINKEKQKIEEIRTMFLDIKADLDDLASSIVDDTSSTEDEKGFFEKTWNGVTEQRDKLPEGVKTGAKVVGGIVTGVLIWKGVKKLFGWGDDKEKEDSDKEMSRWKKGLLGIGGLFGGIALWKNRGSISDRFSGLFGKEDDPGTRGSDTPGTDPEKMAKKFETLDTNEKTQFNVFAESINDYTDSITGDSTTFSEEKLGGSSYDKNKQGLVPFILNNRYDSINAITKESTLYYEMISLEGHALVAKLKGWTADQLGALLMPLAEEVDGLVSMLIDLGTQEKVDGLMKFIAGNQDLQDHIRSVFRKSTTVVSYISSRKRLLAYTLVERELEKDTSFASYDEDKKLSLIQEKMEDEERMEKYVSPTVEKFGKKSLYESISFLEKYDILHGEFDALVQQKIDEVDERKYDILEYDVEDPDNGTILDRIQEKIQNGSIEESDKEQVLEIIDDVLDDMDSLGSYSFATKYLPLLSMLGGGEQLANELYESGQYEALIEPLRNDIKAVRDTISQGNLYESDIMKLSDSIDDYFSFVKQLEVHNMEMDYIVDGDGDLLIRLGMTLFNQGKNVYAGSSIMIKNGEWDWDNGAVVITGAATLTPFVYAVTHPIKTTVRTLKAIRWTVMKGTKLAFWGSKNGGLLAARYGNKISPNGFLRLIYRKRFATLQYDFYRGRLSYKDLQSLFKKEFLEHTDQFKKKKMMSLDDFLKETFAIERNKNLSKFKNILEKYGSNKKIMSQLVDKKYYRKGVMNRVANVFDARKANISYSVNLDLLKKVHDMHVHIEGMTDTFSQTALRNILLHTKNLSKAEDLLTLAIDTKNIQFLTDQGVDAAKFGKYLGKYAGSVDDINDIVKYMKEAKAAGKLDDSNVFMRNAITNWSKLKKLTPAERLTSINTLRLNHSLMGRSIVRMKNSMQKTLNTVKSVKLRSPYPQQVQKTISNLTELINVKPETYKALRLGGLGSDAGWIKSLSSNTKFIDGVTDLLKNKDVVNQLKGAKTVDAVKDILRTNGIDVSNVADDVFKQISQTKNIKRVSDYLDYAKNYKELNKLTKILKHPSMKYMGKLIGRALVIAGPALTGLGIYADLQEADMIAQTNQERADTKRESAWVSGGFGLAADVGAGVGLLAASGALVAIPGVGWVAGGVLLVGLAGREIVDVVYDTIDKYQYNYMDFLQESPLYIKQHIVSIASHKAGVDTSFTTSFGQWLSSENFEYLGKETSHDAMRALVYFDAGTNYPLAFVDTSARNNAMLQDLEAQGITRDMIVEQQKMHADNVEKRVSYLQQKLGVEHIEGKEYISVNAALSGGDQLSSQEGIKSLDKLLIESQYHLSHESFGSPEEGERYMQDIAKQLQEQPEIYSTLDILWKDNREQLIYNHQASQYFIDHMQEYGSEETKQTELLASAEYLDLFMLQKTLSEGYNMRMSSPLLSMDTIDYVAIRSFLLDSSSNKPTVIAASDLENPEYREEFALLDDKMVLENHNTSSNTMQNILYRMATEVLGTSINNDLDDIYRSFDEKNEERHGIYFKDNNTELCINNRRGVVTRGADDDYSFDGLLSNATKARKFRDNIESSMNDNDLIKAGSGTTNMNQEIGKKYLDIFDKELDYWERPHFHKTEIISYIKEHASDGYIQLPIAHVLAGTKIGIPNIGNYVYHYDGKTIQGRNPSTNQKFILFP